MSIAGIIPARYASSRFPGKPLANIQGKSMIQRVYEQVSEAGLDKVLVATDDRRILEHVQAFGGESVMTSPEHQSGTDRCYEAFCLLPNDYDYIINIQGDEPFVQPLQIKTLASCFSNPDTQIATLIKKITVPEELFNPNTPKVVVDQMGQAIYFSRHPIPYCRQAEASGWLQRHEYYKHIGIYGYRADILAAITRLPPSPLEKAESLEQLRWLDHRYRITTAITDLETFGIDTPEDLDKALQYAALWSRYLAG
jgi:3-deoxy-manno-octulosonate cytidylyltransferase (CMP-KDO synthetase)